MHALDVAGWLAGWRGEMLPNHFVEGALHPFVCNATFFQALYFPFIFYSLNIECYVQWKLKEHCNAT
jgi:hypothetical protein